VAMSPLSLRGSGMLYAVSPDQVGDVAVKFDQPGHRLGEGFPLVLHLLEVLVDLVVEFN
jgi:hypothetical protein